MTSEEFVKQASKGLTIDRVQSNNRVLFNKNRKGSLDFGIMPSFSRAKILKSVKHDSTVRAAITALVDKAMENGYTTEGKDGKSNINKFQDKLDELHFEKLRRQILYNLFTYNNVFIEIEKAENDETKGLYVLETTETEPIADEHGEVHGYIQLLPPESQKEVPTWKPDEVTHISISKLSTSIWGELDIEAIYRQVLIKDYIWQYIGWLFGTNQLKSFYNIKQANSEQVEKFLAHLKKTQRDIEHPMIAEGEIEHTVLRTFDEGQNLLDVIRACDEAILELMQVPPIVLGKTDDSNRSNSDAQLDIFSTRIQSVLKIEADAYMRDLFPKMGFEKIKFIPHPIIKRSVDKMLENSERMLNMGFKKSVIEKYLREEGFPVREELFDPKADQVMKKSEDMMPSRQRKSEGEGNEKIGTGEEGSTREDQMRSD